MRICNHRGWTPAAVGCFEILLWALAACGSSSSPKANEGSATPVVVPPPPPVIPDAAPEPAMVTGGVALEVTKLACTDPQGCDALRDSETLGEQALHCEVGSLVQLRRAGSSCTVVVTSGKDVFAVATDLLCTGPKRQSRVTLASAQCAGKTLALALAVGGSEPHTVRLTCQPGAAGPACAREPMPPPSPQVAKFLGDVKTATEAHRWKELLAMCSPAHKKEQITEMGMSQAQYIAEMFGLHSAGNSLVTDEETIRTEHLARIQHLDIRDVAATGDWFEAIGYVELDGNARLRLSMMFAKEGDRYVLTGASG